MASIISAKTNFLLATLFSASQSLSTSTTNAATLPLENTAPNNTIHMLETGTSSLPLPTNVTALEEADRQAGIHAFKALARGSLAEEYEHMAKLAANYSQGRYDNTVKNHRNRMKQRAEAHKTIKTSGQLMLKNSTPNLFGFGPEIEGRLSAKVDLTSPRIALRKLDKERDDKATTGRALLDKHQRTGTLDAVADVYTSLARKKATGGALNQQEENLLTYFTEINNDLANGKYPINATDQNGYYLSLGWKPEQIQTLKNGSPKEIKQVLEQHLTNIQNNTTTVINNIVFSKEGDNDKTTPAQKEPVSPQCENLAELEEVRCVKAALIDKNTHTSDGQIEANSEPSFQTQIDQLDQIIEILEYEETAKAIGEAQSYVSIAGALNNTFVHDEKTSVMLGVLSHSLDIGKSFASLYYKGFDPASIANMINGIGTIGNLMQTQQNPDVLFQKAVIETLKNMSERIEELHDKFDAMDLKIDILDYKLGTAIEMLDNLTEMTDKGFHRVTQMQLKIATETSERDRIFARSAALDNMIDGADGILPSFLLTDPRREGLLNCAKNESNCNNYQIRAFEQASRISNSLFSAITDKLKTDPRFQRSDDFTSVRADQERLHTSIDNRIDHMDDMVAWLSQHGFTSGWQSNETSVSEVFSISDPSLTTSAVIPRYVSLVSSNTNHMYANNQIVSIENELNHMDQAANAARHTISIARDALALHTEQFLTSLNININTFSKKHGMNLNPSEEKKKNKPSVLFSHNTEKEIENSVNALDAYNFAESGVKLGVLDPSVRLISKVLWRGNNGLYFGAHSNFSSPSVKTAAAKKFYRRAAQIKLNLLEIDSTVIISNKALEDYVHSKRITGINPSAAYTVGKYLETRNHGSNISVKNLNLPYHPSYSNSKERDAINDIFAKVIIEKLKDIHTETTSTIDDINSNDLKVSQYIFDTMSKVGYGECLEQDPNTARLRETKQTIEQIRASISQLPETKSMQELLDTRDSIESSLNTLRTIDLTPTDEMETSCETGFRGIQQARESLYELRTISQKAPLIFHNVSP